MSDTILFAAAAAGLVAAVLALILVPALKGRRKADAAAGEAKRLLAAERSELEAKKAAGSLSDAEYEEQVSELERRVLEELAPEKQGGWKGGRAPKIATAVILLVLIPAAAWLVYQKVGNPEILGLSGAKGAAVTSGQTAAVAGASDPAAEMQAQAELRAKSGITEQTSDEDLERWCRAHPEDGRAAVMYARRMADRKLFGPASEFYSQALEHDAKARNPVVYTEAAAALVSMPEPASLEARMKKAAEWLDAAFAMQPGYGNAMQVRCAIAIERGEWALAERLFRSMAEKFPKGSAERAQLEKDAGKAAELVRREAASAKKQ